MKYKKEWENYLDKLNACCRATHLTALHTKSCVVYVDAVVEDVNEVAKGLYKIEEALGKTRDYYQGKENFILVR